MNNIIPVLSTKEIFLARKAGKLASELLSHLGEMVRPGSSTLEMDTEAEKWTQARGAKSGPLGYKGFPKSICTSINEVVCHGIPSKRVLKDGDIINIDVTPVLNGFHGDTSKTFLVGDVSDKARQLVQITEKCLYLGIEAAKPGGFAGDIGAAIQEEAEKYGYGIVKDFTGHGTGRIFHGPPAIPHFGEIGKGIKFLPGMVFTIEPMLNFGDARVRVLPDQWTAVSADNSLSAQFEHTILITEDGNEILTK